MRRGMTLVELTVALAVAVMLFSAAVSGIGALTGAKAKEATTELAGVMRTLYDTASLTGKTCRLVFEIPGGKDDDVPAKYRAECAAGAVTAARDRDSELKSLSEERRREASAGPRPKVDSRFTNLSASDATPTVQELLAREKGRVEDSAKFSTYTDEEIRERTLPNDVRVKVWTRHQRAYAESGSAFLYFFPSGFTERAQVTLTQGSNTWTLSLSPLTGKVSVVPEMLEVPRT